MNNLTTREKAMAFGILLILIIFLVYFFGIRILNDNYEKYTEELKGLQDRKKFLDELKEENANTEKEIKLLNENIEKIELSFIDKLETEVIEQYLLAAFEKNECPYLSKVAVSDISMTPITMADGSTSPNSVLCRNVAISYATTDGFLPTQYNATPSNTGEDGRIDKDRNADMMKQIQDEINLRVKLYNDKATEEDLANDVSPDFEGYDGFIKTIKEIAKENPDCVKLVGIKAETKNGFMTLTATVQFFGAVLENRVSVDNNKGAYTWWSGATSFDTKGGLIGRPYVVWNKDSAWYLTVINKAEVDTFTDRPYAPYYINAYFTKLISQENGMSIVTGGGIQALDSNKAEQKDDNSDDYTQVSN